VPQAEHVPGESDSVWIVNGRNRAILGGQYGSIGCTSFANNGSQ
jgi:hypothetical protein